MSNELFLECKNTKLYLIGKDFSQESFRYRFSGFKTQGFARRYTQG